MSSQLPQISCFAVKEHKQECIPFIDIRIDTVDGSTMWCNNMKLESVSRTKQNCIKFKFINAFEVLGLAYTNIIVDFDQMKMRIDSVFYVDASRAKCSKVNDSRSFMANEEAIWFFATIHNVKRYADQSPRSRI